MSIDAFSSDYCAEYDFIPRNNAAERGEWDGHLNETGVGFLRLTEQLRGAVELLEANTFDIAKILVEPEHPLAKRDGNVLGKCIWRRATGNSNGEAGACEVAGLCVRPFVPEHGRYAWFEIGEGEVLQKIKSIDTLAGAVGLDEPVTEPFECGDALLLR